MSKTVLITGAAVRVGRAISLALADDGWDCAIHYRHSQQAAQDLAGQIEAKGRKAHLVQADLEDEKQVAGIIPSLLKKGVVPDALINNASVFEKNNLAQMNEANWQKHMRVNCFSPLLLTRDFATHYKGSEGNVIHISDGLVGWSLSPVFLSYAMSKMALEQSTLLLVRELAPRIRINTIAPGPVLEGVQDKPDTFAKLEKIIPLGRTGTPEDIVRTVRFILNSPSLTGQIIALAGGVETPPQWGVQ